MTISFIIFCQYPYLHCIYIDRSLAIPFSNFSYPTCLIFILFYKKKLLSLYIMVRLAFVVLKEDICLISLMGIIHLMVFNIFTTIYFFTCLVINELHRVMLGLISLELDMWGHAGYSWSWMVYIRKFWGFFLTSFPSRSTFYTGYIPRK